MSLDVFLATALSPSALASIAFYLTLLVIVAVIEVAVPLHARTRWSNAHLIPNLVLTATYIGTNLFFSAAIVLTLIWCGQIGFGVFNAVQLDPWLELAAAVLLLDFLAYAIYVAMHERAGLWRFHRIHHSDPAVDVTTALRQHPGESLIRFSSLIIFAGALGVSPAAFAIYRLLSGIQAQSEHANIRLPRRLDSVLSLIIATPNYHKIHHSREVEETNSNYANIFTLWDRLFFTSRPAHHGVDVDYGLDAFDARRDQNANPLALPFRDREAQSSVAEHA